MIATASAPMSGLDRNLRTRLDRSQRRALKAAYIDAVIDLREWNKEPELITWLATL